MNADSIALAGFAIIGFVVLVSFVLVIVVGIKIVRMKIRKEVGLLKSHLKYHPARPQKRYKIKD